MENAQTIIEPEKILGAKYLWLLPPIASLYATYFLMQAIKLGCMHLWDWVSGDATDELIHLHTQIVAKLNFALGTAFSVSTCWFLFEPNSFPNSLTRVIGLWVYFFYWNKGSKNFDRNKETD
jgi:hypothetical protein